MCQEISDFRQSIVLVDCMKSRPAMEVDADRLLVLVEARPLLYNFTLADHHNKDVIEKLWEEIAKEMNCRVADCKAKWINLRSSYSRWIRENKNTPSGSGASKKKKWYLADAMGFLLNFVGQHKRTMSNLNRPSEIEEDNLIETAQEDDNSLQEPEILTEIPVRDLQPKKKVKKTAADLVAGPMVDFLKSRTSMQQEQDPMHHFFQSLLPDAKKLAPRRQRKFKTEVLKLLNTLVDEEEDELSRTSSAGYTNYSGSSTSGMFDFNQGHHLGESEQYPSVGIGLLNYTELQNVRPNKQSLHYN